MELRRGGSFWDWKWGLYFGAAVIAFSIFLVLVRVGIDNTLAAATCCGTLFTLTSLIERRRGRLWLLTNPVIFGLIQGGRAFVLYFIIVFVFRLIFRGSVSP